MRKKAKELEKDEKMESDPKLVIPALARAENRAYKPGRFQNFIDQHVCVRLIRTNFFSYLVIYIWPNRFYDVFKH